MHSNQFRLATVSIILIASLLKIIAACVAYCARYQDATGLVAGQCLAEMSGFSHAVLYD